jgi:adenine phosphoribosyltransferase
MSKPAARATSASAANSAAANSAIDVATAARAAIRSVKDFPKPGILFRDITPLLANAKLFRQVTDQLGAAFVGDRISHVVAVESRGFIFGAPIAQALGAGLVPVRKPGKLPSATFSEPYALEYGNDALEIHVDALPTGSRVLVVDDVLATGGTSAATCRLVERAGGLVVACVFLIELEALKGRARLGNRPVSVLLAY